MRRAPAASRKVLARQAGKRQNGRLEGEEAREPISPLATDNRLGWTTGTPSISKARSPSSAAAGAASGFEAAAALGACGVKAILASRDQKVLANAVDRLLKAGVEASSVALEVTDPSAVARAARAIVGEHGKVDILVNSAGSARLNSALDTPDDEWRAVIDVNVNGMFWCCRAFGRHMLEKGKGSIVNLGSMSGLIINRPQTAPSYMASKGAVHMLTKALAAEWAKGGVRVNALAPGYVATEMTVKMRERPELFKVWLEMTPMGRLGESSEIAAAVLFLASPASSYGTGAILPIDGATPSGEWVALAVKGPARSRPPSQRLRPHPPPSTRSSSGASSSGNRMSPLFTLHRLSRNIEISIFSSSSPGSSGLNLP
jgi:galactitol 2-dehydrogenase (L-tagatose-forming)